MPARAGSILVILDRSVARARVLGSRRDLPPSCAVAPWTRLPQEDLKARRFAAVLYPADRGTDGGRARLSRLKRLAPGALLLPYRPARSAALRGARNAARPEPALSLPLDLWLLGELLAREQHAIDLRKEARHATLQVRDREAKFRALAAIVRCTGNELDPQRIVTLAMNQVSLFIESRGWLFYLLEAEQGVLTVEQTGGQRMGGLKGTRVGLGEGAAGKAAQRRQPVLSGESEGDGAAAAPAARRGDARALSSLAVPLLSRGRVIGVVEVLDTDGPGRFRSEHARLLTLLLEPAAVAVDNALLLKKSEELSITDDLTKLHNSRFLNTTLRREVERSRRYRTPVSLIFLDLDGFKDVNDQHGHLCGSRTLVEVGEVIKGTVREIDVVSRYGGDEFTVILPQTGPEGAQIIAERIRQRIAETAFLTSYGLAVRITASVGIASYPDHGRTKDDLIARADQAMYQVKGRGKNGVALSDAERPRPVIARSAS